ncbi:MAG: MFS transporter [Salinicola sp.]|uniref:MFS transporter n=1 Tax=uncultured Salinicola sp. TaxID=1193542 RepID=UPI000C89C0B4|nr:MFS transporter [uncultured Salinicola sp.]MAM57512.1 MFS transporter [Salinicola sp.]
MAKTTAYQPTARSRIGLDSLNFFLADVRDGVGPFLGIYLLTRHEWSAGQIGVAMSAMTFATMLAQSPAGMLLDITRFKRALVAVATLVVAICSVLMTQPAFVNLPAIVMFQALMGVSAAFLLPAVAAMTLGMVGNRRFPHRQGRNEVFNHAGNVVSALLAGALAHFLSIEWLFYALVIFALGSLISVLVIREADIDHDAARGKIEDKPLTGGSIIDVLRHRRIVMLGLTLVLFHFANAAMLPLVGQYLTIGDRDAASLYMSACIVIAQLVMIPVAWWAGRRAISWGRLPVFMIGLLALPLRGALYAVSNDPLWLLMVQALDGIGAGIFGVLWLIVAADLTHGTGRYNVTVGVLGTLFAMGAASSNLVAGYVVEASGYAGDFLFLAAFGVLAPIVYRLGVGETRPDDPEHASVGNVNFIPTA